MSRIKRKRFWTDYPDGRKRYVQPVSYDGDKYVTLHDGDSFKRGYLHHGRLIGPVVSHDYAMRFITKRP